MLDAAQVGNDIFNKRGIHLYLRCKHSTKFPQRLAAVVGTTAKLANILRQQPEDQQLTVCYKKLTKLQVVMHCSQAKSPAS